MAQLVARYLGVVEAASSSLVTQTISSVHNRFKLWTLDIFLLMLTFRLILSCFEQVRLLFFCFRGYTALDKYSMATPLRESRI